MKSVAYIKRRLPDAPEPSRGYIKPKQRDVPTDAVIIELPNVYKPIPEKKRKGREGKRSQRQAPKKYGGKQREKYTEWTEEREKDLIKLFNEGASYRKMASEMGCTVTSCYAEIGKLRKEGRITTARIERGWTGEQIETLIKMYNDGASLTSIGKAVGRSQAAVSMKVVRLKDQRKLRDRRRLKKYEGIEEMF